MLLILYLVLAAYFFAVLQYYSADNYHNIILIISMIHIIHIIFIISISFSFVIPYYYYYFYQSCLWKRCTVCCLEDW